ncbi:uncharacterized protein LOC106669295 [Cimex lectularius]|uniref:Uncharacterized protein n=1 Tax=Cimex lectularius TaxID=79782 RepID=A0A8I6RXF3_CIMLE|nr:uncharacterized protein LOC106669295 [Cimex lectularius]
MVCQTCRLTKQFWPHMSSACWTVACLGMSKIRSPLIFTLAIGSAAIAIYFWVEASELQSTIILAQEARDVAEVNNIELEKRIQELKMSRPSPLCKTPQPNLVPCGNSIADKATRQLVLTMRRLSDREKEACRNVTHLVNELEGIRKEIHEAYKERNKYRKKICCLERYSSSN